MTENPLRPLTGATPREEKLQAIAAIFGEAVAARLGHAPEPITNGRKPAAHIAADRIAWQTNRLIQLLRERSTGPQGVTPPGRAKPPMTASPQEQRKPGPRALPPLVAGEDLAAEHPAVIAHMLRDAPQDVRVAVLRALPGQLARMVMGRMRIS